MKIKCKKFSEVFAIYIVFADEYKAMQWFWLFNKLMKRQIVCAGGYFNAYCLISL